MIRADIENGVMVDGDTYELMDDLANIVSALMETLLEAYNEDDTTRLIFTAVNVGCINSTDTKLTLM